MAPTSIPLTGARGNLTLLRQATGSRAWRRRPARAKKLRLTRKGMSKHKGGRNQLVARRQKQQKDKYYGMANDRSGFNSERLRGVRRGVLLPVGCQGLCGRLG